jgi:hypothetical protein
MTRPLRNTPSPIMPEMMMAAAAPNPSEGITARSVVATFSLPMTSRYCVTSSCEAGNWSRIAP